MSREAGPVFLARRAYFQRRLTDAARLLPVLGVGLFALPLLWKSPETGEGTRTVLVMFYVFLCWIALTGLSWLVSRRLSEPDPRGDLRVEADRLTDSRAGRGIDGQARAPRDG